MFVILFVLLFSTYSIIPVLSSKIDPGILTSLQNTSKVTIVVSLESNIPILMSMQEKQFEGRAQKISTIKDTLESFALTKQKPIVDFLSTLHNSTSTKSSTSISYKSFWISNIIIVNNADLALIQRLSEFELVEKITEAPVINLVKPVEITNNVTAKIRKEDPVWGVKVVGGETAWKNGYTGKGILVGSIDSGARYTHQILRSSYIDNGYGWFDALIGTSSPRDTNGHGTHTIGTIVGKDGYGLAPDAKWMSCRAFGSEGATTEALGACLEFMLCPTNSNGDNADCSKLHIFNSWTFNANEQPFFEVSKVFHEAGIILVFASGNEGPSCGTTKSPGDSDVISVGSVGINDILSRFSSKGPGGFNSVTGPKPDIVAPGESTISAYIGSDTDYASAEGTSMATPLISGAVALMLQIDENLSYESVRRYLFEGTERKVSAGGYTCGGTTETTIPNNMFGYGRLNVWKSINLATTSTATSTLKSLNAISYFFGLCLCMIYFI